jgi:uncharacterized protein with von Willebrand factor type A (vWA) domain
MSTICGDQADEEKLIDAIHNYINEREEHLTLYSEHFDFYYEKLIADRDAAEKFIKEHG